MTVLSYHPETCYPMLFQAPHQPWDVQQMFSPVQHGYGSYGLACYPMQYQAYYPQLCLCLLFCYSLLWIISPLTSWSQGK